MNLPDPISEKGLEPDLRRRFNRLLAAVKTLQIKETATTAVDRTAGGTFVHVKPSAGGGGANNVPRWG
jgi:hypothetical protein